MFVDGCWWHRCPEHGMQPKAHGTWWAEKFTKTVERDRRNTAALEEAGWTVIRVWEHEPVEAAVSRVATKVSELRNSIVSR